MDLIHEVFCLPLFPVCGDARIEHGIVIFTGSGRHKNFKLPSGCGSSGL